MKIVCTSRGSRGDVYPVIEIASALSKNGCDVVICVPRVFEPEVRSRSLRYRLYSEDSGDVMRGLGHGLGAIKTALDWFSRTADEQFEFMLAETTDADALVSHAAEIAAPTAAEHRKIPLYRIAYTPILPGNHPPPLIPWQGLPDMINRRLWHGINLATGLFIKNILNTKRSEIGLPNIRKVDDYFAKSSHTVFAMDPVLAPPCRSWNGKYSYTYTGYCFGEIKDELNLDLKNFIDEGEKPVYIGFGSVSVKNPEQFTEMVVESAARTGLRMILGTGWTGLGCPNLPKSIFQVADTPHATLFPLCAGVAHHGGSGTTHTAAVSGTPQFIMPQIADQYFWGDRVKKLGMGPEPVQPKNINLGVFMEKLKLLCGDSNYSKNSNYTKNLMLNKNGAEEAARHIMEKTDCLTSSVI
jgi:UDP:flavonoid glycosyltransferase YjiC (YdhE family)